MLLTEDIYLAAFGLVRGGELVDVDVRGTNGRRMAFFRIDGAATAEAEREYFRGNANVNLQLLKAQVRRLKDVAFDAMRREERSHASESNGNRRDQTAERPGRGRHRAWD